MRKTVVAAAMAATLTIGGAAGVALFSPTSSGAQTDQTTEAQADEVERPRLTERLRERLEPLVDDGVIDDAQADAVAEHLAEQAPLRRGDGPGLRPGLGEVALDVLGEVLGDDAQADAVAEHLAEQAPLRRGDGPGLRPGLGEAALDVLGLDAAELREQLAGGQSLREIAEANGVDVDALVEALLTAHEEHLDDAVADGRLTEEQADEREATLEAHVQDLLDRTFDGHRGPGPDHDTPDS